MHEKQGEVSRAEGSLEGGHGHFFLLLNFLSWIEIVLLWHGPLRASTDCPRWEKSDVSQNMYEDL